MFQLNRKADYGLRLMVEVGAHLQGTIGTAEIARRQQIPYHFLRKVVQVLVSHGLLASERGAGGGLTLARPAETITMLEIVRAFNGGGLSRCAIDPDYCDRRDRCAVYPVLLDAQQELERTLGGTPLSALIQRQQALERAGRRDDGGPTRPAAG